MPNIIFPAKKNSDLKQQDSISLNSPLVSPLSWANSLDNMDKKSLLGRSNKISLNKKCKLSPELQLFHAIQDNRLNEVRLGIFWFFLPEINIFFFILNALFRNQTVGRHLLEVQLASISVTRRRRKYFANGCC